MALKYGKCVDADLQYQLKLFQQLGRSFPLQMFLFPLGMLNVYFILHYHLFFCKEIYFFECLYFSKYDIRMSLYVFWLLKVSSIKYVRSWWGNRYSCVRGEGVSRLVCTCALALIYWKKFLQEEIFAVEALPQLF